MHACVLARVRVCVPVCVCPCVCVCAILEIITGLLVYSYSFIKKGMPITMASKSAVNTGSKIVEFDLNLLFQRLAALLQQEVDKKGYVFI